MKKLILLFTFFIFGNIFSQNIFRDYFNTYTTGNDLSGQGSWTNNSSNPGGLGTCTGAICSNAKVISTPISYINYGSSPKSIELKPNLDGCGTSFTASNSTNLYVAMVINISNASSVSPTDFFRVMSGSNTNVAFRVTLQSFTGGFYVGISKANGTVFYFSQAISYNTNHLIVLKYTRAAGTNDDALRLYVDPSINLGEPSMPSMATATGTDVSGSFDRMCFRQNASIGLPTGRVGLVSVSGSWTGLIFPTLANETFEKDDFIVSTDNTNSGLIEIYSNSNYENSTIKLYDLQGRIIENKSVSLVNNVNLVSINPIQNKGIYIIEIITKDNKKFVKKIVLN